MNASAIPSWWHFLTASLFSLCFLIVSDMSTTWLILLTSALIFVSGCFWFKNIKAVLFFAFMFTNSISISKALIVEGGIYTPGLSITISDLFLIPLLILWFSDKKIIQQKKIYWSNLHDMPLYFLLWLWFTISFSTDRFAGVLMCVSYTKYFLIFYLTADFLSNPKHLKIALCAFAMGLCAHFSLAFLEVSGGNFITIQGAKTTKLGAQLVFENAGGLHAFRPSGFAGHPNSLANLLVFALPPLTILFILGKNAMKHGERLIVVALLVVGIMVLITTLSRGGWISLAVAIAYLFWFGHKKGIVPASYIKGMFATAVLAGLITVIVYPAALLRITESDQRSGESRIAMMYQAALIIKNNPIGGVGIAGYNRAARANIPDYFSHLSVAFQEKLLGGVVHNKYLLVMAETGIIGLTMFLIMICRFVYEILKGRYWTDPVYFSLALGFSAGLVGQMVFYMLDHFYADPRMAMLYTFFGFIAGVINLQKKANRALPGETSL